MLSPLFLIFISQYCLAVTRHTDNMIHCTPLAQPSTAHLPVGTRHRRKHLHTTIQPACTASMQPNTNPVNSDLAARLRELETLPNLIKEKLTTWKDGARPFQIEGMRAQVLWKDLLIHAATGSGKTGIAAGPHLLPSSKGKVTIFVSPLLALYDEQVCGLLRKFIRTLTLSRLLPSKRDLDSLLWLLMVPMEAARRNWPWYVVVSIMYTICSKTYYSCRKLCLVNIRL